MWFFSFFSFFSTRECAFWRLHGFFDDWVLVFFRWLLFFLEKGFQGTFNAPFGGFIFYCELGSSVLLEIINFALMTTVSLSLSGLIQPNTFCWFQLKFIPFFHLIIQEKFLTQIAYQSQCFSMTFFSFFGLLHKRQ